MTDEPYCQRPPCNVLHSFFYLCRSGKGAVHIWNLNTRRAEKVLDGHGGTSVIWVSTLQTAENLLRWGRSVG